MALRATDLTPKPSKTKTTKKEKIKGKSTRQTKTYQKLSFSVISQNFAFCFGGGVQKLPFLTTWPRNRAPPKHYKTRGFSTPIFEKQLCVTKRPFLDKKNQIPKFQLSFFFCSFLLCQQQKHKHLLKPVFYSVLANLKKRIFKKWKQRNLKNPILGPFFLKRLF